MVVAQLAKTISLCGITWQKEGICLAYFSKLLQSCKSSSDKKTPLKFASSYKRWFMVSSNNDTIWGIGNEAGIGISKFHE